MEEIWKDIPGYVGHYQVSDMGRVKSFKLGLERILKPYLKPDGYLSIELSLNNNRKRWLVHRLVLLSFVDAKEGKEDVNHKDFNKANNRLENLEWMSPKENTHHAMEGGVFTPSKYFLGGHHSEETKRKMRERHPSEETKRKMRERHPSEETKRKMSISHKGELNHMYGKLHTEESKKKMSIAIKLALKKKKENNLKSY